MPTLGISSLEQGIREGENPVCDPGLDVLNLCPSFHESSCLGMQLKVGGRSHLKLNISERPIANKYCEGKLKRILERKSKGPEIVKREAYGTSDGH